MGSIASAIEKASKHLNWFGVTIVLSMLMALVAVNVAMRYSFNAPIIWAEDVIGLLLVTMVFFGFSHCWVKDGHVRMGLLYGRTKGKARAALDTVVALVGLFFWGLLFYQSLLDVAEAYKLNEMFDVSKIIIWPFRIVLSVGLLMLNLQFVLTFSRAFLKILGREEGV
jgi:TRAP-type C4-dicarboxylate transport system permease small subunit